MPHETITPNPWMILPFGLLLAGIALAPLFAPTLWLKHYAKFAFTLGGLTLTYYLGVLHAPAPVRHAAVDYLGFIALIGSLYVVAGGIHISVKGEATPLANVLFLLTGAILANVLGTTGASMLLIRPWLRMNKYRVTAHHVVFFIFIVANVGGCLTPIGDPPLLLGFFRGVPFFWVIQHCWPMWLLAVGLLLGIFFVVDTANFRRAPKAVRDAETTHETWRVEGWHNVVFLGVILGAVFLDTPPFAREALMLAAALGSWFTTKQHIHEANHFHFHPLLEVAILFVGIFATMIPALQWLEQHADKFGAATPTFFYWACGSLSSVLDNAPTYLSFFSVLVGAAHDGDVANLLATRAADITAISLGAVFFGAATYIGNGPNFMVKAIADAQKVRTPGFLGYLGWFTLPFLLPVLALVWLVFLR
jgi:Na+/H+ antiporter NhaD/arsenite permease-like protein